MAISNSVYADPAIDKANAFLDSGRAEAAASIYQQVLRQNPGNLSAQLALATIAMRHYEYQKAQAYLEKALTQHPESGEAAASLGRLYQFWGNAPGNSNPNGNRNYTALATEYFNQARQTSPSSPLVLSAIAEWEIQQNDLVSAERDLQQALRVNPNYLPALQATIRFHLKTRDLMRARDAALHAMDVDAQNSLTYLLTAETLGLANQPAEAVRYATKSEQLDFGRLPERDYFLATQYEKLGELTQALHYYELLTGYTPKDAQIWMKLGDLYDRTEQGEQSLAAYRKAMSLNPGLLNELMAQARDNARNEKVELGVMQWRRILNLQGDNPAVPQEAWGSIAGLHYLDHFLHPDMPNHAQASKDLASLEQFLSRTNTPTAALQLARIKLQLAISDMTPLQESQLASLIGSEDPGVAGEAAFLLDRFSQADNHFEDVDGLSAEDYTALADRLLLSQELVFSQIFYQRAYELNHDASLKTAMKRAQAKQALASHKVNEGNLLFNDKKYKDAIEKYKDASRIYREWDTTYLRLADTYERLHQWPEAKAAYDKAIALTPNLMDSQGFSKNYNRIKKKVASR